MTAIEHEMEGAQRLLVSKFSSERVSRDFFSLYEVAQCVDSGTLRIEIEGRWIEARVEAGLTIVSVVLQVDLLPRSLDLRVVAALGGATEKHGLVDAEACFVILHYNELAELISVDWSTRLYA